ncbi:hypothetical protein 65p126 [Aeromonas phage 65]|uniref:Uncharacterized protein n=2 Tax=Ishigurovirus osborne TaxID=260149 RepID=A0A219YBX5_9CAUD|nr:hypothetical protein ST65p126 [Aeromonas phage 65]ADQ53134.1 hypothetical protein 65p126 [Aeromonas phage 65]APU01511.1 hypothetical protein [Aeromonas phage 65.2]
MSQFVVTLVDPSQFNDIERMVVDTSFIKGLSERKGLAYITVETKTSSYKTIAVHESFDHISNIMIQTSRGYL